MKTTTESLTMQNYWIGHFFENLSTEPEFYRDCMIIKLKSSGRRSTLEHPDNFREFVSCWIFVHCFFLFGFAESFEVPELRRNMQQKALAKAGRVCRDLEAINEVFEEFLKEIQTRREMREPGFSVSPGAMLTWSYSKRLQVLCRMKHNPALHSELPSQSELALISRIIDDTMHMTLKSFSKLLKASL